MPRFRIFAGARVRNAPRLVSASLVGVELGSPLRRCVAGLIDLGIWLLFAFPTAVVLGLLFLSSQIGGPGAVIALLSEDDSRSEAALDAKVAIVHHLHRRKPEALSPELREALAGGDPATLRESVAATGMGVSVEWSTGEIESYWDEEIGEIHLANDVLFGIWNRLVGVLTLFLAAFTFGPRLLRGWTPGKWLLGLRVVRTDGKPLRLWDCFSRAGGYLGSLGMGGLGFLEAAWDANAQAAHDKLADTLVVRAPRFKPGGASAASP